MSKYECLEELACAVLGTTCFVENNAADDNKGKGSSQIRLTVKQPEGETEREGSHDLQIFAKKNALEGPLYNLLHVVDKEAIMYDKVIPCVLKFLDETNSQLHSDIKSIFLHYYGRGIVSENHYFLFEDLLHSQGGKFMIADSDTFHPDTTVHAVMKSIAKFHGVFHSMKNRGLLNLKDKYPILTQNYLLQESTHDVVAPFYNGEFHKTWTLLNVVLDCFSQPSQCKKVRSKLVLPQDDKCDIRMALKRLNMLVDEPLKLMEKMRRREKADNSILIHGDFHPFNIAVSDLSVIFFDYQLIRYSDGLSDVHQYLSQGTSPKQRKQHLTSYLETYHETLADTCKTLGMDGSPYGTKNDFMEEYTKLSPLQIPYGFSFLMWKYVTDSKAYEELANLLKSYESSDVGDKSVLLDDCIKCIDKLGPRVWEAIQILFEFVTEIQLNGTLDQI